MTRGSDTNLTHLIGLMLMIAVLEETPLREQGDDGKQGNEDLAHGVVLSAEGQPVTLGAVPGAVKLFTAVPGESKKLIGIDNQFNKNKRFNL